MDAAPNLPAAPDPRSRRIRRSLPRGALVLPLVAQSLLVLLTLNFESSRAQDLTDVVATAAADVKRGFPRALQDLPALPWSEPAPAARPDRAREMMRARRKNLASRAPQPRVRGGRGGRLATRADALCAPVAHQLSGRVLQGAAGRRPGPADRRDERGRRRERAAARRRALAPAAGVATGLGAPGHRRREGVAAEPRVEPAADSDRQPCPWIDESDRRGGRADVRADRLFQSVLPLVRLQARKSGTRIGLDLPARPPQVR